MSPPHRPLVIAHRGASAVAPEHTIAAFERALELGADGLQLDVHLSRDDQPVVIHDYTLERTTDGAGAVRALTVRELKRLDAGRWFGGGFEGQRLQTLQEVLERFRERTRFWIELRGGSALYPGLEERVVGLLEVYDVLARSLVQSDDVGALRMMRSLSRDIRLGMLVAYRRFDPVADLAPGLNAVCPSAAMLGEAERTAIRAAGRECHVWTVNEPVLVDRLVEWRADGLITDRPELVRARLDGPGPAARPAGG
ncbi:MAG TPA: glycerophosphodiester phosphodiesterase family protein [Methylomirabilota bacterium]|nr:glycerophosphodiester phosphodiesterase family protein [Methylomirabilota bacterium]